MITPAKRVSFETKEDVINYVTKGIAPCKKDFNKAVKKSPELLDSKLTNSDLELIYKNKKRNELVGTALAAISVVGAYAFGKSRGRKEHDPNLSDILRRIKWSEF